MAAWSRNTSVRFRRGKGSGGSGRVEENVHRVARGANVEARASMTPAIDIADFLRRRVQEADFVVMKMDVEGAEYSLVPHLIAQRVTHLIDEMFIEVRAHTQACTDAREEEEERERREESTVPPAPLPTHNHRRTTIDTSTSALLRTTTAGAHRDQSVLPPAQRRRPTLCGCDAVGSLLARRWCVCSPMGLRESRWTAAGHGCARSLYPATRHARSVYLPYSGPLTRVRLHTYSLFTYFRERVVYHRAEVLSSRADHRRELGARHSSVRQDPIFLIFYPLPVLRSIVVCTML